MEEFNLNTDYIALCDLLKLTSLCSSGGQAKMAITEGLVKVDGIIEYRKKCKIRPGSTIEYSGSLIKITKPIL